jgi:hypothetical protein
MDRDVPAAVNQFPVHSPSSISGRVRGAGSPVAARLVKPVFWLAALALAASNASCSVIGMKRLEPGLAAGEQPECTSSWTMPLFDGGVGVVSGSVGVLLHAGASRADNEGESSTGLRVAGWSAIGVAAIFIASAVYGTVQRGRCRNAEVAYENLAPPDLGDQPLKGAPGAACRTDADCGEDLLCGEPMKTCVPANQPDQTPPP